MNFLCFVFKVFVTISDMLFRLSDGTILRLTDEDAKLSEFFLVIKEGVNLRKTLEIYIMDLESFPQSTQSLFDILPENLEHFFDAELREGLVRDMVESAQEYKSQEQKEVLSLVDNIVENYKTIFQPCIHIVTFLSDEYMTLAVNFLSISHGDKKCDMMADVPMRLQTHGTTLGSVVDPSMGEFVKFIEKLTDKQIMEMSRVSCLLGIQPLVVLCGCRIANILENSTHKEVRDRFKIPEKFSPAVSKRLELLPGSEQWSS